MRPPILAETISCNNVSAKRRGAILIDVLEFNHKPAKFYCPKKEREESIPPPTPNLSQVYGIDRQHGEADSNFLPVLFSQVTT